MITVHEFCKSKDFPYKELYKLPVIAENFPVLNEIARYINSLNCGGKHTKGRTCRFCK